MNSIAGFAVILIIIVILGALLFGWNPMADAERAKADRARAEAEAYVTKLRADVDASVERSAIRQAAMDATLQRSLVLLPFVLLPLGAMVILAIAMLIFWDLRQTRLENKQVTWAGLREHERLRERARMEGLRLASAQIAENRRMLDRQQGLVTIDDQGREVR